MNGLGVFASLFLATVLAVFLTLGAVRGDAERGLLQPLVVRPSRPYARVPPRRVRRSRRGVRRVRRDPVLSLVVLIVHQAGGSGPTTSSVPGWRSRARSRSWSRCRCSAPCFLSSTANGIAMFMLYGAGLVSGLLAAIGAALNAHTVLTIAATRRCALPFEGSTQAALHALGSNQTGLTRVLASIWAVRCIASNSVPFDHLGGPLPRDPFGTGHGRVRAPGPVNARAPRTVPLASRADRLTSRQNEPMPLQYTAVFADRVVLARRGCLARGAAKPQDPR